MYKDKYLSYKNDTKKSSEYALVLWPDSVAEYSQHGDSCERHALQPEQDGRIWKRPEDPITVCIWIIVSATTPSSQNIWKRARRSVNGFYEDNCEH